MNRSMGFLVAFALLGTMCGKKGQHNPEACNGDTRRDVKLMQDVRWALVDTVPVQATIQEIGGIVVPEVKSETGRQDVELKTYTVTGYVEEVDRKRDGDYHILLKSGEDYLICEVPNPDCDYAASSPYNAVFRNLYELLESENLEGRYATVTGIAFIDIDHHYSRKQAPNNMELHPVIAISY